MKEYGTNIQKLADCIMGVYDREQRTKQAHVLIELMRQIHPNMREGQDYNKKLWDDLYIITNFELDVDSPYPPPPKEILGRKPQPVPYNQNSVRYRFYGRNIEILILKACATENIDERRAFVSYLIRQMKAFYQAWNKETVAMDDIYEHLSKLSAGKLDADVNFLKTEGLVDSNPKDGNTRFSRPQAQQSERTNPSSGLRQNNRTFNNRGGSPPSNNNRFGSRDGRDSSSRNNTGRDNNLDRKRR